jgi:hypothetical protein
MLSGRTAIFSASQRRAVKTQTHLPCSSKNFSASMAAAQPDPAAVIAWRLL